MLSLAGNADALFLPALAVVVAFALLARHVAVHLIFFGVLPPLLYSAAWSTSSRTSLTPLVSILSLAFGLVTVAIL